MSATGPKLAAAAEAEQVFFADPAMDRLAQVVFNLASEVHVLRDRVRCLEFLLAEQGQLDPVRLDAFRPSPDQAERLTAERDAFVRHLMDPLDGRARSRSGPPLQD
jgi:hypothetical protein